MMISRSLCLSEALLQRYFPPHSERHQTYSHQSSPPLLSSEEPLAFSSHDQHYQQQDYDSIEGERDGYNSDEEEETREGEDKSYVHVKQLAYELRRKNPDLLDKIRFAMDDKHYGVFLKLLAQGAFWGAAMYAVPLLMIPIVAARAIGRSRLKQISRRDMGIPPRYHLRPGDTY